MDRDSLTKSHATTINKALFPNLNGFPSSRPVAGRLQQRTLRAEPPCDYPRSE